MANSIRDQPLRKGPIQLNFGSYGNVFQLLALGAVTNAAIAGKLFNFEATIGAIKKEHARWSA